MKALDEPSQNIFPNVFNIYALYSKMISYNGFFDFWTTVRLPVGKLYTETSVLHKTMIDALLRSRSNGSCRWRLSECTYLIFLNDLKLSIFFLTEIGLAVEKLRGKCCVWISFHPLSFLYRTITPYPDYPPSRWSYTCLPLKAIELVD